MNEKQLSKFFFLMLLAFLGIAGLTASQKSLHIVQSSNYEDEINQKEESEISYSESNAVLGIDGVNEIILTQNIGENFTEDGVDCPGGDSWWFRSYDLSSHGLEGDVSVTGLEFALTEIWSADTLYFYAYELSSFPGSFDVTNPPVSIADTSLSVSPEDIGQKLRVTFDQPALVTSTSTVVIAVVHPTFTGNKIVLATTAEEITTSYVGSNNCGFPNPIPVAAAGFPDASHFLNLVVEAETTEPGIDCDQGDDSNYFEDGLNITLISGYRHADDFFVSAGNSLNITQIEINVLGYDPVDFMNFNFYGDDNGKPNSDLIYSLTDIPVESYSIGGNWGRVVYTILADVELDFEGGTNGTRYWMQPEINAYNDFYWEVTSAGSLGNYVQFSEFGTPWQTNINGNVHGVFKLHCEPVSPPEPVCLFDITTEVQPITRVIMGNVDNSSAPDSTEALEDFSDIKVEMVAGGTYEIALEGNTKGYNTNYFSILVDLSDGQWLQFIPAIAGTITGSTGTDGIQATTIIEIPEELPVGEYPMRIIKTTNGYAFNPCSLYEFGQGEDYTLKIIEPQDCTGTPDAGIVTAEPNSGVPGSTYTVSSFGYTFGDGLTYQWQSNTDGAGWVDEGTAESNYSDYIATAPEDLGVEVEWKLTVTCTLSGESAESTTDTFVSDYCMPTVFNNTDYISSIISTGADYDIAYSTSSFPGLPGYVDETTTVLASTVNQVFDITTTYVGGDQTIGIWIDWNGDGIFEGTDERLFLNHSLDASQTITITVPDVPVGDYRMRIRGSWFDNTWECDNFACAEKSFGTTVDFTFRVSDGESCSGTPEAGTVNVNPSTGNPGTSYTVKATGYSIGSGLSNQWQSNTDGNGWVDEGEASEFYSHYTATAPNGIGVSVEWRLVVSCTISGESAESDTDTFTTVEPGCGFETPSNGFENGYGDMKVSEFANDFVVNTNENFTVEQMTLNVLLIPGYNLEAADISFYQDSGTGPGEQTGQTQTHVEPVSDVIVGSNFGFDIHQVTFDLPTPVMLNGNTETETIYWIGVLAHSDSPADVYWEVTTQLNSYKQIYFKENGNWYPGTGINPNTQADGVMTISGSCDSLGVNDLSSFDFTYYPNPVKDILNISSQKAIQSVEIFNLSGQRIVHNSKVQNNQLNLTELSTGTYIFRVTLENGQVETFKIIKK